MPAAAWGPSSSPSTTELHREVALKQILDSHCRRPDQPPAVPSGGGDHRRVGAPGHRPGLRPGDLRRRPALLRHAVHPRRQPQGGHRPLPRRRRPQVRPRPAFPGAAQAAAAVPGRLQRGRLRPLARRPASGHQAGQCDRRPARRDPGGRLGIGQGHRQERRAGRRADFAAQFGQRVG